MTSVMMAVTTGIKTAGWRAFVPLGVFAVLFGLMIIVQPNFLTTASMGVLFDEALPILLLALGQMPVLLIGAIDLSVAAVASISAMISAWLLPSLGVGSISVVLLASTLIGALNGVVVAVAQVPSFIVTLGALGLWQAVANIASGGQTVPIAANYDAIGWIVDARFAGLAVAVWIGLAIVILALITSKLTVPGRRLAAIGLNEKAAILSGVEVIRLKIAAFAAAGLAAGITGIILAARQYATAPGLADELLLPCIAAAIIGGCAITGGVGNPAGVLLGALVVTLLRFTTTVVGIGPEGQQIIYGTMLIVAVALTINRARMRTVK